MEPLEWADGRDTRGGQERNSTKLPPWTKPRKTEAESGELRQPSRRSPPELWRVAAFRGLAARTVPLQQAGHAWTHRKEGLLC
ncbi:hypothetical protein NDU88_004735 [Pleurodeles waltl]|uniref:Uncharacterized protein n=1 Tax=Pleurodeles waltl TaxID=8319 RepID=A0AAV7PDC4_PLEWA|nr:hypothetical protein NDU88_004735 [Pleurodeles waltl]